MQSFFLKPIPTFTRFSFLPGDFLCVLLPRRSHMHALRLETTLGEIIKVCLANKWRAHLQRCLHVSLVWTSKVQLILRFNLFSSTANSMHNFNEQASLALTNCVTVTLLVVLLANNLGRNGFSPSTALSPPDEKLP